jgi:hypothetical protein
MTLVIGIKDSENHELVDLDEMVEHLYGRIG